MIEYSKLSLNIHLFLTQLTAKKEPFKGKLYTPYLALYTHIDGSCCLLSPFLIVNTSHLSLNFFGLRIFDFQKSSLLANLNKLNISL
jgi:hypothetical protein